MLADRVSPVVAGPNVLVLALPRGGVRVAFEVAQSLHADLDIFLVRKLGLPGHEELGIGAIASGGVCVLNEELVAHLQLSSAVIDYVTKREQLEIERREGTYREGRPALPVRDREVVLVDDGLATAPRCWRRHARSVRSGRGKSSLQSRLQRSRRAPSFAPTSTRSYAPKQPSLSTRSAFGTKISRRPPTRRSANCWNARLWSASREVNMPFSETKELLRPAARTPGVPETYPVGV